MASKDTAQASFSFDTVAVLVAALYDKGVSIGMKEYKRMAELDGSRGAFGFQHAFRKVTARAKELSSTGPGEGTPEKPNKGGGKKDKTNGEKTPKRCKCLRKPRRELAGYLIPMASPQISEKRLGGP